MRITAETIDWATFAGTTHHARSFAMSVGRWKHRCLSVAQEQLYGFAEQWIGDFRSRSHHDSTHLRFHPDLPLYDRFHVSERAMQFAATPIFYLGRIRHRAFPELCERGSYYENIQAHPFGAADDDISGFCQRSEPVLKFVFDAYLELVWCDTVPCEECDNPPQETRDEARKFLDLTLCVCILGSYTADELDKIDWHGNATLSKKLGLLRTEQDT